MKTRLEIQKVTFQIDSIKNLTEKNNSSQFFTDILEKANQYSQVEKSLKGRVEIFGKLSQSLRNLAIRSGQVRSIFDRFRSFFYQSESRLWQTIDQLENYQNLKPLSRLSRFALKITELFLRIVTFGVVSWYRSQALTQIKEASFRTVKNLSFAEMGLLDPKLNSGMIPTLSIESLKQDLTEFIPQAENKEIVRSCIEQLGFAEEISQEILILRGIFMLNSKKMSAAKIADLSYQVEKKIDALQTGQNVLIPAGFAHPKGGHAVAIEIRQSEANQYEVILYNTGDGALNGLGIWGSIKTFWNWKSHPIIFKGLSKEAVLDSTFLTEIFLHLIDFEKGEKGMNSLFSTLDTHCREKHNATRTYLEGKYLQSWGTCAHDSILSYLEKKLLPHDFKLFQSYMAKKANETLQKLLPSSDINPHTIEIIQRKSKELIAIYS